MKWNTEHVDEGGGSKTKKRTLRIRALWKSNTLGQRCLQLG